MKDSKGFKEEIEETDEQVKRFDASVCIGLVTLGLDPSAPELKAYQAAPCDMTFRLMLRALKRDREAKGMGLMSGL